MQLEKTVETQASLWYLSTDLILLLFFLIFFFECTVYEPFFVFEYTEESIGSFGLYWYRAAYH